MVHWPTQAAINQLTMRAATLALAFAATAAGLVAPSHANCLPGAVSYTHLTLPTKA